MIKSKSLKSGGEPKLILQSEMAECGLACIAMISSYFGRRLDLHSLRRDFSISSRGMNLQQLIHVAGLLNLHARPLRAEMGDLSELTLPCILHWDMKHFVVLTRVSRKSVQVLDPAIGQRTLTLQEAEKHFTGVALELTPRDDFEVGNEEKSLSLSQVVGQVRGVPVALTQLLVLGIVIEACIISGPIQLKWIVDEVFESSDLDILLVVLLVLASTIVLQTFAFASRGWMLARLGSSFHLQWMSNAVAHLLRLPISFFERRSVASVVSRFESMTDIKRRLTIGFGEAFLDGVTALVLVPVMLLLNWQLACASIVASGFYGAVRWFRIRAMSAAVRESFVHESKHYTTLIESIRRISTIKVFRKESERQAIWTNQLVDQFNVDQQVERLELWNKVTYLAVYGLERIVVIGLGAAFVMSASMSIGAFVAYFAFRELFASRFSALVDKLADISLLGVHTERLSDILLHPTEQDDFLPAECPPIPKISLKDVTYRYAANEQLVLRDVSFTVNPGEFIAISGVSGGGKSTLMKLLIGLAEPTTGQVLYDGLPLSVYGVGNYRKGVAAVLQDDGVLFGSILENISFFDPDADKENVFRCAQAAAIHEDIVRLPMGYQTLLGGYGGLNISGGQLQRILLARAIYRNPTLLFLDEATSHLDIIHEKRVNEYLKRLNITRIIVAHRPDTIMMADRVLVIENGQLTGDYVGPDKIRALQQIRGE